MTRLARRQVWNRLARAVVYVAAAVALVPLALVLAYTVSNGLPAVSQPEFYVNAYRPVGIPGAGVSYAITGTLIMVSIASAMAVPLGVVGGVFLAEYGSHPWARTVRLACDVLVGTPSIAIGLIVFATLVAPFKHFSGLSGSAALAILMLPVVVRTCEGALLLVPNGIREAGLALGVPRWRVSLQLILPAGAPGVVTGCLLAVARAAGETAPLLFTAFGNRVMQLDPQQPMAALPLIVFHNALTPFEDLQRQAWGAALLLVVIVLVINLGSRFVLRRQIRLAARLQ